MSCNYCWNQPKKYERHDLYLDGKIKADDFIYRTKDESGEIIPIKISEKFEELENRLETHFTFDNSYKSYDELEEAFVHRMLKESVIYIVMDDEPSDDPYMRDRYNEYMIMGGKLELIGSGSYIKQTTDLLQVTGYTTFNSFDETKTDGVDINSRINKEIKDREADVDAEEKRAQDEEKRIEEKLVQEIKDREADVDAEEKRAIKAENELSTYIKKEEEIRTSQINGINQEAKQNRNRIEQLESKVSTETTRAIEAENELGKRIDQENKDREADVDAEEKRAIKAERELKDNIDEEVKLRTSQINGINQEAKDNRNRIEQLESKVPSEINRAIEAENNLLKKFDDYATKSSLNDYTTTTVLEENYSTKAELNAVDKKFEDYVTIQSLQEQIATLEKRIAALEPTPEPENGEVTDPTGPETPTE